MLGANQFKKMSDSFITIVPTRVTTDEVIEISKRTIDWLTKREIISQNLTDCILGQTKGYPPGSRYNDIVDDINNELNKLKTNGLEITVNRQVFHNGERGLNEIRCPKCRANNIDSDWGEILDSWSNQENDVLKCIECYNETSITNYDFRPKWGFGEFGITFWNWPNLKTDFLDDLKKILNKDIEVIYGRL
jgi:hypothetical protein